MNYQQITNNKQFANYCKQAERSNAIALDSEFIRTKTFYPHIGLLQIFDNQNVALVDPLQVNDWQNFIELLKNPNIEKYFHSCSEDLEVFNYQFNHIANPIIDSQILASFLDNPISSGYAVLVNKYLNVELDKSETRTDWLNRPLTEKQYQYAANDVFYLIPLVAQLKLQLTHQGWLEAAYNECETIIKRKIQPIDPNQCYLSIKRAEQLRSHQLGYLQQLAKWRFNYAKQHDIALNFVVHEEILWRLARYQPTSLAELSHLGLKGKSLRLYGEILLTILSQQVDNLPLIKRINYYPDYKKWQNLIKEAAQSIATKTGLNEGLLVSKRHIEQFLKWYYGDSSEKPDIINGWRGDLFKPYLSDISIP